MLAFCPLNCSPWLCCAKTLTKPHTDSDKQMESNAISKILNDVIVLLRNSILGIKTKFQDNNRAPVSLSQTLMPIRQVNSVLFGIPVLL